MSCMNRSLVLQIPTEDAATVSALNIMSLVWDALDPSVANALLEYLEATALVQHRVLTHAVVMGSVFKAFVNVKMALEAKLAMYLMHVQHLGVRFVPNMVYVMRVSAGAFQAGRARAAR